MCVCVLRVSLVGAQADLELTTCLLLQCWVYRRVSLYLAPRRDVLGKGRYPRHTIIHISSMPWLPGFIFLPLHVGKAALGDTLYSVCCDKAFKKEDTTRR